jgi:hypothetical protein
LENPAYLCSAIARSIISSAAFFEPQFGSKRNKKIETKQSDAWRHPEGAKRLKDLLIYLELLRFHSGQGAE